MEAGAATAAASRETTESRNPRNRRRGGRILDVGLNVYAGLALLYLLVPIAIILVYSFNNPRGRFNFVWQECSLDAWKEQFACPGSGMRCSPRSRWPPLHAGGDRARNDTRSRWCATNSAAGLPNFFIFIPLATPEVVLGAALLSMFINFSVATGFTTIVIAHVMFNLSFVIVTVRSRLIGFDRSLEEAAQDLGATPWQTFRLITLPLIMPGVLAAGLLAFALR